MTKQQVFPQPISDVHDHFMNELRKNEKKTHTVSVVRFPVFPTFFSRLFRTYNENPKKKIPNI